MSASDALEAFTVNTLGAMLAVKALAPALGQGPTPGSVVLFSTVAASVGFPNHSAIAAAKGGVEAFVRAAAAELAPRVRVNALAPSLTDTPLAARMLTTEAMRKALGDAHPIPRLGTSEELAQLAVMLLTPEVCGWINGQIWQVDGGRSTVRPKN
jgi:NAD(P)-dependent dehydrogenase (short-subunit alcohol dehydrogenase family)